MREFLFVFWLALIVHPSNGQETLQTDQDALNEIAQDAITHRLFAPGDLAATRQYMEARLQLHEFDRGKWKAIVGGEDFSEDPLEKKESQPQSLPWAGPVLKIVAYAVIICVVIFLLYYISTNITFDLLIEKSKLQTENLEDPVDDIDALDIDALIVQARNERNFRMVIRLYYLGLLKKLNAGGIILWKKDKTNRDYLSELFIKDFHYRKIHGLTVAYEAVWYGEHTLRGESLERLTYKFEDAYRGLNTGENP